MHQHKKFRMVVEKDRDQLVIQIDGFNGSRKLLAKIASILLILLQVYLGINYRDNVGKPTKLVSAHSQQERMLPVDRQSH
jgi:hypothetical protein